MPQPEPIVPPPTVATDGNAVAIVDRGRGPQLSTCRITVQDLVPYLQQNCTHEEIMAIMPVLTKAEIEAVQRYVRENYNAVMEQDRRIRERAAKRTNPPEIEEIRKKGRVKTLASREEFARSKAQGKNADPSPR